MGEARRKKMLGIRQRNPEAKWSIRRKRFIHLMQIISNYKDAEIEKFARRRTF